MKQYKQRCAYSLDCENEFDKNYYFTHVNAMTAESLHSKSDIAAELAVRDVQIDSLIERVMYYTNESGAEVKGSLPQFEMEI